MSLRKAFILAAATLLIPLSSFAANGSEPCRAGLLLLLRCDGANLVGTPEDLLRRCMECCVKNTPADWYNPDQCILEKRRDCQSVCQLRYEQRISRSKEAAVIMESADELLLIEETLSGFRTID